MIGIYYIFNKTKDKYYVESSRNIEQRINNHKFKLNSNKHEKLDMQKDYANKDVFEFIVAEELSDAKNIYKLENNHITLKNSIETGYNSIIARECNYDYKNKRVEILKLMIDKDVNNRQFAKSIGKSESFVSLFLNGNRDCTMKTGKKIAEVLEVKLDDIF